MRIGILGATGALGGRGCGRTALVSAERHREL